jgi:hypothetical protein
MSQEPSNGLRPRTSAGAGMDSAWEQEKPEARTILDARSRNKGFNLNLHEMAYLMTISIALVLTWFLRNAVLGRFLP